MRVALCEVYLNVTLDVYGGMVGHFAENVVLARGVWLKHRSRLMFRPVREHAPFDQCFIDDTWHRAACLLERLIRPEFGCYSVIVAKCGLQRLSLGLFILQRQNFIQVGI